MADHGEQVREALENEVYELIDPDGMGWASGDAPSIREIIDALLASDWLKAHDAEVAAATAERIAVAIENERDRVVEEVLSGPLPVSNEQRRSARSAIYLAECHARAARADEGNPR